MAKRVMEPMHDEHVNVTPLIDVVMCLIIFFLLVGKLAKDETTEGVHVPAAMNGQEIDQQGRLIVNVLTHPGVITPHGKDDIDVVVRNQSYKLEELTRALMLEKADAKQKHEELQLVVRADRSLPYQYIAPVLVSCAQADIHSVNFSTEK